MRPGFGVVGWGDDSADDDGDDDGADGGGGGGGGSSSSGPQLKRSYSSMTEAERRQLIEDAIKEKVWHVCGQHTAQLVWLSHLPHCLAHLLPRPASPHFTSQKRLEEELAKARAAVSKKNAELEDVRKQLDNDLYVPGEREAMEKGRIEYFELFPERSYDPGSAAEIHLRLAESQFYRLLMPGSQYVARQCALCTCGLLLCWLFMWRCLVTQAQGDQSGVCCEPQAGKGVQEAPQVVDQEVWR